MAFNWAGDFKIEPACSAICAVLQVREMERRAEEQRKLKEAADEEWRQHQREREALRRMVRPNPATCGAIALACMAEGQGTGQAWRGSENRLRSGSHS